MSKKPVAKTSSKATFCKTTVRRDAASDGEHVAKLYQDFYAVVRKIPRGAVVTYGQLAELAGRPGAARAAGAAMRVSPSELGLPWQRVVGKRSKGQGQVQIHDPVGGALQRQLLEEEGVEFSDAGGISLARFGWLPS